MLLTGANFINKGAEAMIRCVQDSVLSAIPDAEGLLDVYRADDWTTEELRGLRPREGLASKGRWRRLVTTSTHCVSRLMSVAERARWLELVSGVDYSVDIVLDISGYGVGDPWVHVVSPANLRSRIAQMIVTDRGLLEYVGIPILCLPQAWGPFEKRKSSTLADRRVKNAVRVYARDRESLTWLQTLPSYLPEKVRLASDVAFTFKGASSKIGQARLRDIGVRLVEGRLIGIVPNMRVYERTRGEASDNVYVRCLVAVARHFSERLGCQVAVMPHEIKRRIARGPDDRFLCELVANATSASGSVSAALGDYSAEELKAMIGEAELLISSRFHSIVAALSLRRPVVSIAWSHKYHELLSSVGLGDYVVAHEELDKESLCNICEQAWRERHHLQELLEENVPKHEASARQVLQEVVELINGIR